MAYDEYLSDRVQNVLNDKNVFYEARKMMGGLCFMVDNKMCLGIVKNTLMARIGPDVYEDSLKKEGCKEMNFTGRAMKGFVYIDPIGVDMEDDLVYWVQLALDFNPFAKASKKKAPKKSKG